MSLIEKVVSAYRSDAVATLAQDERPTSLAEAEHFQDVIIRTLGFTAAAWKLGASNHGSRAALGFDRPFSGLLRDSDLIDSGAEVDISTWRQRGVECELTVRFAKGLLAGDGAALNETEVRALLGTIHPGLEIPHTRFATLASTEGAYALVADNGASGKAVIGPASGKSIDEIGTDCRARLSVDSQQVAEGSLEALTASPLALVTDHINRLRARGYDIKAGEYVLLGSLTPYHAVAGPGLIEADFGSFGRVSVRYR